MTRLYLKVFFTFWLITALIIVATNIIVHWFDLTPERKLHKPQYDRDYEPARRLLFQMVGSAINRDTAELVGDMEAMPVWSTPTFTLLIPRATTCWAGRCHPVFSNCCPSSQKTAPLARSVTNTGEFLVAFYP